MTLFEHPSFAEHEQIAYCFDKETGLKAIVAIHNTLLGPALGGCRMWPYLNDEEALTDVLRLSRGMTYKAAITGLSLGGGKAVILGDPAKIKSKQLFRSFGRFIDSLSGYYITAEDVNIRVEDMDEIAKETRYFTGGSKGAGDPSPMTALGVFYGIKACLEKHRGSSELSQVRVAIEGSGNVGSYLCELLREAGAQVFVSDLFPERAKKLAARTGATAVETQTIHQRDVDVFAPCALGGGLHEGTIPEIKAPIIAGGANNQLLDEKVHGKMLQERKILYAPDYAINAGGVVNCFQELKGYDSEQAAEQAKNIYSTILNILEKSEELGVPTIMAANQIVEDKLAQAKAKLREKKRHRLS